VIDGTLRSSMSKQYVEASCFDRTRVECGGAGAEGEETWFRDKVIVAGAIVSAAIQKANDH